MLASQPVSASLQSPVIGRVAAGVLIGLGQVFVITSFIRLGFYGTFLGMSSLRALPAPSLAWRMPDLAVPRV
jgi:hypothetical protein